MTLALLTKLACGTVLGCTLIAATVPMPELPLNATPTREVEVAPCPSGGVWRQFYNTTGDPANAEITVIGRVGLREPMVWIFYMPDSDTIERIVLTLPGLVAEEVTYEELIKRYPSPCDLPLLKSI